MAQRGLRYRLSVVALLAAAALFIWLPILSASGGEYLKVTFLDVGQGDAIFIETPDGVQVLIDGGPDTSVLRALGEVMPVTDRTIDVVMATHPDKDHVGGLVSVLERYQIDQIIRTENESETAVGWAFLEAVEAEGSSEHFARAGQVWALGERTLLSIYAPASDPTNWESNASSIVAQLRYGDIEFLLTGDVTSAIETYLARTYSETLASEVLKLAHHGSRTSTAEIFIETVSPLFSVVSAGKDNTYGHPHKEVLERVRAQGSQVLNTAEQGSITFLSDGVRVWVEE